MKKYKAQFIEFMLDRKILTFGEFILKSGRVSPYFFNAGLFNKGSDLIKLGRFYADALMDSGIECDLLFGPAYKGIPITITTAMALYANHHLDLPYCFNRKEIKDHGEGGGLVGGALQGKVLLVDDVITAGTTIRESVEIIHAHSASLAGILVALDRQERGNGTLSAIEEIEQKYQSKVISIVTLEDMIYFLKNEKTMVEAFSALNKYAEQYGILRKNL